MDVTLPPGVNPIAVYYYYYEFLGICSGVDEVSILRGRDAMSLGFWFPLF